MRYVQIITQQQTQCMLAGSKGYLRFRLSASEVPYVLAESKRFFHVGQTFKIDQQMVMPGIWKLDPGRSNSHVHQPESYSKGFADNIPVFRGNDIRLGAGRRFGKMLFSKSRVP